jgi:dihydropteroate synthase
MTISKVWSIRGGAIDLEPWALMGVVNATPDSFSDGGLHLDPEAAAAAAVEMIEAGATVIDVGGESTRPGADRVDAAEQIRRVVPVIEAIRSGSDVAISIDTTLSGVARAAIEAGANAINDVAAGTEDPAIFGVAAETGAGLVLMHRRLPPTEDRYSDRYDAPPTYGDVVAEVTTFLLERAAVAESAGVDPAAIALDPGLGFGKSVEQNFALIARLGEIATLGRPLLFGASRKSFIGAVAKVAEPAERVPGSVVAAVAGWSAGAKLIRTHDVAATRQGLEVARAVLGATPIA